jgi:hypothetical protein
MSRASTITTAGFDGAGRRHRGVSEQTAAKVTGSHLARTAYL